MASSVSRLPRNISLGSVSSVADTVLGYVEAYVSPGLVDNIIIADPGLAKFFMPFDLYLEQHRAGAYGENFADHGFPAATARQRERKKEEHELYYVSFGAEQSNSQDDAAPPSHDADGRDQLMAEPPSPPLYDLLIPS